MNISSQKCRKVLHVLFFCFVLIFFSKSLSYNDKRLFCECDKEREMPSMGENREEDLYQGKYDKNQEET